MRGICAGQTCCDRSAEHFELKAVLFHGAFYAEFGSLAEDLQDELLAHARLLAEFGPTLGRPTVATVKGSRHANMKELRFSWDRQIWRVAFAFDPHRQAILLVGDNKGGANQRNQPYA